MSELVAGVEWVDTEHLTPVDVNTWNRAVVLM